MPRPGTSWILGLAAAGLFTACAITGCNTPEKRHKTLSFFFDGVPDPVDEADAEGKEEAPGEEGAPERRPSGSRHPSGEEGCRPCHGFDKGHLRGQGFSGVGIGSIERAWKACGTCHSQADKVGDDALIVKEGAWLHGPVAVGRCQDCHRGHQSKWPHLLRAERLEEICLSCHDTLEPRSGTMAGFDCVTCHDPHAAPSALAVYVRAGGESLCLTCHRLDQERRPWLHGPLAVGACAQCHDAHGRPESAKHVRRPIRAACLGCHEEGQLSIASHPVASAEECDACHDPHAAGKAADLFLRERIADDRPAFLPAARPEKGEATPAPTPAKAD